MVYQSQQEDTIWVIERQKQTFLQPVEENDLVIYLNYCTTKKMFITQDKTGKAVTYTVGYVDDLIVADRSNQHHVSKQVMECMYAYSNTGK